MLDLVKVRKQKKDWDKLGQVKQYEALRLDYSRFSSPRNKHFKVKYHVLLFPVRNLFSNSLLMFLVSYRSIHVHKQRDIC